MKRRRPPQMRESDKDLLEAEVNNGETRGKLQHGFAYSRLGCIESLKMWGWRWLVGGHFFYEFSTLGIILFSLDRNRFE